MRKKIKINYKIKYNQVYIHIDFEQVNNNFCLSNNHWVLNKNQTLFD